MIPRVLFKENLWNGLKAPLGIPQLQGMSHSCLGFKSSYLGFLKGILEINLVKEQSCVFKYKNNQLCFTKGALDTVKCTLSIHFMKCINCVTPTDWANNTEIYRNSSLDGCDFGENNCDTQSIKVDGCILVLLKKSKRIQFSFFEKSCLLD